MTYIHDEITHNTKAASVIVPLLFRYFQPTSVLDVGCGIGTWLSVFKQQGVQTVLGVDGDHVNRKLLHSYLSSDEFLAHDLAKPLTLDRKFDLVTSLEVAEHLPESSADDFIDTLVKHGEIILFSAAIPEQGGQGHINEQWPDYWQSKFEKHGFRMIDPIRSQIWANDDIEWWYKQNIFLFLSDRIRLPIDPTSNPYFDSTRSNEHTQNIIHPDIYLIKAHRVNQLESRLADMKAGHIPLMNSAQIFLKSLQWRIERSLDPQKK